MKFNFFIGYDSKEDIAYRVCKYSLLKRTNSDVNVMSLKLDELIAKNLYTRSIDPLASTQFTYSRFLVPKLTNYEGWAVFCDCDFIFLGDVSNLLKNLDENKLFTVLSMIIHQKRNIKWMDKNKLYIQEKIGLVLFYITVLTLAQKN